jgi:mRNA (2'-O-methyladenosine-N6-)-methyltransferase
MVVAKDYESKAMDIDETMDASQVQEKLLEDEASCVQRWMSFENEKKNELLNKEIELYRKMIQNELAKGGGQKSSSASAFLQLQLETTNTAQMENDGNADGTANNSEDGDGTGTMNAGEEDEAETYDVDLIDPKEWMVPPQCIPVHANVTTFDWKPMYEHTKFDVIMMDPPWQLATANPTRGVSLGYSQLTDAHIADLPIPQLQENGFLFVWVINAKYQWCLNQFKKWGYEFVDEIAWVKVTNSRRLAKSHGFYLQHAKEVCLVARRGKDPPGTTLNGRTASDVIFAARRGQSQKPTEIYELIEQLVPNGKYLEIFARKNNLRDYWVSVGNEVTGTGLPPEDVKAFAEVGAVPAAKYGAAAQK